MRVDELRKRYLAFFADRDHKVLPSAPLVPNDPTLLFTAAGMVPFKDLFWGRVEPSFRRATTCQKCFRTTDIENVGRTAYHHTFFEMLGNFSFGSYFKEGAIEAAWGFLIDELRIPVEKLSVSVFEDDEDAAAIWLDKTSIPADRIVRLGKKHNWWGPVGDSGPCGPDSEIFFDAGEDKSCGPDCEGVACECDRFSEIWNLVFMQYDAQPDGSLRPLDSRSIDTGMGLERTAAVLQGASTDYEIDTFRPIVEAVRSAVARGVVEDDLPSIHSIADHVRALTFLVSEGVMPGNERQGYVMRRILRRAIRAGERLALPSGSLETFVEPVIDVMGETYPELGEAKDVVQRIIQREEETFRRTLREGERRLTRILDELRDDSETTIPGDAAFELFDTYGFPLEMTQEIASDVGLSIDLDGFESALDAQRARSSVQPGVKIEADSTLVEAGSGPSEFVGYEAVSAESDVDSVIESEGRIVRLVFLETPFYAEAGGQVTDTGRIANLTRKGSAVVSRVVKNSKDVYLHAVEQVEGSFESGDRCRLTVDVDRRRRIERNHTATHLLHAALREVLGTHVAQAGSVVNDQELRFDFSHFEKVSDEEIARVEAIANAAVLADLPVTTVQLPPDEAKASGAIGLFEDEYRGRAKVRVVTVAGKGTAEPASKELCGGTHVRRSGEIGLIKIVSEESIASGVRRIRAITGDGVLGRMHDQDALVRRLKVELGDDPEEGVLRLKAQIASLEARLEEAGASRVQELADDLKASAEVLGDVRLIGGRADIDADNLKSLGDALEERSRPGIVILVGESGGRGLVVCKISKGIDGIKAGDIVRAASKGLGGGGGGGPTFAQGGGPDASKLDQILAEALDTARIAIS